MLKRIMNTNVKETCIHHHLVAENEQQVVNNEFFV